MNYDSYSIGVHIILNLKEGGAIKGIHGTVAGLMAVDTEHEEALSAAMYVRGYAHAVVVENDEVAERVLWGIRGNGIGNVTLLPLDRISCGRSRRTKTIENEKGFVGYAIDLIRFDEKYRTLFRFVLGDTIVTETLDDAVRIVKKYRKCIVTKKGELILREGKR
jgi:chromosome segregation protein